MGSEMCIRDSSKIGGVKLSWIKAVFLEDPTRSKLFIFYPWKSEK